VVGAVWGVGGVGRKGLGGVGVGVAVVVGGVVSVVVGVGPVVSASVVSVSEGVGVGVVVLVRGVVVCGYSRTEVLGTQVKSGSGTKPGGTTCDTSGTVGAGGG
jgi:hypothetical protein